jgi:hypothetical protein
LAIRIESVKILAIDIDAGCRNPSVKFREQRSLALPAPKANGSGIKNQNTAFFDHVGAVPAAELGIECGGSFPAVGLSCLRE